MTNYLVLVCVCVCVCLRAYQKRLLVFYASVETFILLASSGWEGSECSSERRGSMCACARPKRQEEARVALSNLVTSVFACLLFLFVLIVCLVWFGA